MNLFPVKLPLLVREPLNAVQVSGPTEGGMMLVIYIQTPCAWMRLRLTGEADLDHRRRRIKSIAAHDRAGVITTAMARGQLMIIRPHWLHELERSQIDGVDATEEGARHGADRVSSDLGSRCACEC